MGFNHTLKVKSWKYF